MLTRNAFDDRENKQNNMVESIHKFKYMISWGLGVDPPEVDFCGYCFCCEILLCRHFGHKHKYQLLQNKQQILTELIPTRRSNANVFTHNH